MPIYEFSCASCGARFDALVPSGTDSVACSECAAATTQRVMSAPSAPPRLVKTQADARRQEQRNAKLHGATKERFKAARRRARDAKKPGGGGAP